MVFHRQKKTKEHLLIGITETAAGLGATHLCISLANYSASKLRKKTACLELAGMQSFERLKQYFHFRNLSSKTAHDSFRIYDVDYYPNVQKEDIPLLINSGYEILILDFGMIRTDCLEELFRCDKKFLLCSNAPWRKTELIHCLSSYPQLKELEFLLFMISYGTKLDMAQFALDCSISYGQLRSIPFLPNPFHIEKNYFLFFEKLLLL